MEKLFEDFIINDITICIEIYTPKNVRRNINKRQNFGMLFSTCGKVNYYHNKNIYTTDQKHFIIVPKDATYHLIGEKDDLNYVINFECNLKLDQIIQCEINNSNTIETAKDMIDIYSKQLPGWKNIIRSYIYNIVQSQLEKGSINELPNHLKLCKNYIDINFKNSDLTNEKIAKSANISAVYMQKEFKKYLNISPHKYLCEIRIKRAKLLLSTTNYSVTEVAYMIGFSSVYDFSRTFKKSTGLSPFNYKKSNKIHL